MKKAFKANSRPDRFSYLYANPVHTPRLKIAFMKPADGEAFSKFMLQDSKSYLKFIGQGWEEYPGELLEENFNAELGSYLINHIAESRANTTPLAAKRIGQSGILGIVDVYQDRHGHPWAGYYFSRTARGKGYAREAVAAVLETIQKYEHRTIETFETFPDNFASQNLLRSLGYHSLGKVKAMAGAYEGKESLRFVR